MIALICFVLAVLASPFKSKSRLEAENAALRHQLIVLRRKMPGRPFLTNNDRRICVGFCGHIGLWTKMRRSGGRFSGPESSPQFRSSADFITTTSESRFSVHTPVAGHAPSLNRRNHPL